MPVSYPTLADQQAARRPSIARQSPPTDQLWRVHRQTITTTASGLASSAVHDRCFNSRREAEIYAHELRATHGRNCLVTISRMPRREGLGGGAMCTTEPLSKHPTDTMI